jgi:integrase
VLAYSLHTYYFGRMAWLYQRNGSNKWWIGYRVNGHQILRSTKTSDRKTAERQLAKLESIAQAQAAGSLTQEFVRHLTRVESSGDSLDAYRKQWLNECRDLSPMTLKKYRGVLDDFCQYVNATETAPLLRDVQPDTIAAFIRSKREKISAASTMLARRILAIFFGYCVDNRALQYSPVPSAKSLKLDRGNGKSVRRAFTLKEVHTLYRKAPNDFWRYMVMAGYFTGQRMGDLITLPWASVDFRESQIRLTSRKTGRAVTIPLRDELGAFLRELRHNAGDVKASEPIWPEQAALYLESGAGTFSNQFYEEILMPAGLVVKRTHQAKEKNGKPDGRRETNEISFHCLRHTFVSVLKISGASQSTAKELAGHSSDQISDLYTHVDEASLTRAIKQLPGIKK